jgi:NodT family efflux transporter outer membrane factor (OMF) lipoprotein
MILNVRCNNSRLKKQLDKTSTSNQGKSSMSQVNKSAVAIVMLTAAISACSAPSGMSSKKPSLNVEQHSPNAWQTAQTKSSQQNVVINNWLKSFDDPSLEQMVAYALRHNYQLRADSINLKIAKERLQVSEATDFPELSLAIGNSRRKQVSDSAVNYQTDADISVDLSYEIDLWGKLSDEQNQSRLNYAAAQATYQQSTLTLVANISKAWFDLTQAQQLLTLYQERAGNLQRNLAMIQSSYQLGLNDALDVYLTKNDVNQELARVAQQEQNLKSQSRTLELLLGDYPYAKKRAEQKLPFIDADIHLGLPAQLLTRRTDIQASWFELMALDAGLAVAHKQRFPSFNLNASVSDNGTQLSDLLDGGSLAWSLIGNITTPLFNAGRLASLEQQAKLAVQQKEQQYLQQVYQAFADVENSISERESLAQRYAYYGKAQENALAAEKLSFDQYLRGLVTYTTVLESQRRSFDAQTNVIQLTNQLLQNRIEIYSALGGDYLSTENQSESIASVPSTNITSLEK